MILLLFFAQWCKIPKGQKHRLKTHVGYYYYYYYYYYYDY